MIFQPSKHTALIFAAVLCTAVLSFILIPEREAKKDTGVENRSHLMSFSLVSIGQQAFKVIIAETPATQQEGLGGRSRLAKDEAMLFIFKVPGQYGFWMKDMKFPIDIFWIDKDLKVIKIEKSLSPDSYPNIFAPDSPALYVLETNAQVAEKNGIKIGDEVKIF